MGTVRKIARPILQYVSGLIFAWVVRFPFGAACILCLRWYCKVFLPSPTPPHTFGDLYGDFIGGVAWLSVLLVGIPFGASLGVVLVDKLFFKSVTHYIWGTIIGFLMGVLGSAFVCWGFPLLGIDYAVLPYLGIDTGDWLMPIPTSGIYSFLTWGGNEAFFLISTLFALIGYNFVGLFAHK